MLLRSTASISLFLFFPVVLIEYIAEFRGPGVHHNFDDSDSGYDVDIDSRLRTLGGASSNHRGRIILLGDGTEVLTDSDDAAEMFEGEDKDLESQVPKGQVISQELGDPSSDAVPEKLDVTDPSYKAVAEKVHASPAEPTVTIVSETATGANDK